MTKRYIQLGGVPILQIPISYGSQRMPRMTYFSASFDGGIRLWDIHSGTCLYSLVQHKEAVYTISFTPDCHYLASGSFDKNVYVWSLKVMERSHLRTVLS